jgi:hypothetical protein
VAGSADELRFGVTEDASRDVVEALVTARLGRAPTEERKKSDEEDDEHAARRVDERVRVEVRGTFEEASFLVALERTPLQRGGTRPFTEIVLEEDLGATMELRGAHGLHLATDAPTSFTSEALADVVLVGAPNALVRDVAALLDPRFAALFAAGAEVITLEIGPHAERAGTKKRGIRLVCRGWPLDEASLDHLLQTALVIRTKILGEGPALARHPEVIAHERALAFGSPTRAGMLATKRIALVGAAFFVAALLLAALVMLARC